ncbi:hypothetical protein KIPB_003436 [Kipferlia bialata]|uniref:F-box domain-containing protein n=1 Tax=Kipferlia bialata TaxID=797122 RepID=A0A9K3CSG2_9EUKA|nr:hypothetical protein KIPB_003436 [Kipferlia bialata]|eukprot:g3436.t1
MSDPPEESLGRGSQVSTADTRDVDIPNLRSPRLSRSASRSRPRYVESDLSVSAPGASDSEPSDAAFLTSSLDGSALSLSAPGSVSAIRERVRDGGRGRDRERRRHRHRLTDPVTPSVRSRSRASSEVSLLFPLPGARASLMTLPDRLLTRILSSLPFPDLVAAQMSCRHLLKIGFRSTRLIDVPLTSSIAYNVLVHYRRCQHLKLNTVRSLRRTMVVPLPPLPELVGLDVTFNKASDLVTWMNSTFKARSSHFMTGTHPSRSQEPGVAAVGHSATEAHSDTEADRDRGVARGQASGLASTGTRHLDLETLRGRKGLSPSVSHRREGLVTHRRDMGRGGSVIGTERGGSIGSTPVPKLRALTLRVLQTDVPFLHAVPGYVACHIRKLKLWRVDQASLSKELTRFTSLRNLHLSMFATKFSLLGLPSIATLKSLRLVAVSFNLINLPYLLYLYPLLESMRIDIRRSSSSSGAYATESIIADRTRKSLEGSNDNGMVEESQRGMRQRSCLDPSRRRLRLTSLSFSSVHPVDIDVIRLMVACSPDMHLCNIAAPVYFTSHSSLADDGSLIPARPRGGPAEANTGATSLGREQRVLSSMTPSNSNVVYAALLRKGTDHSKQMNVSESPFDVRLFGQAVDREAEREAERELVREEQAEGGEGDDGQLDSPVDRVKKAKAAYSRTSLHTDHVLWRLGSVVPSLLLPDLNLSVHHSYTAGVHAVNRGPAAQAMGGKEAESGDTNYAAHGQDTMYSLMDVDRQIRSLSLTAAAPHPSSAHALDALEPSSLGERSFTLPGNDQFTSLLGRHHSVAQHMAQGARAKGTGGGESVSPLEYRGDVHPRRESVNVSAGSDNSRHRPQSLSKGAREGRAERAGSSIQSLRGSGVGDWGGGTSRSRERERERRRERAGSSAGVSCRESTSPPLSSVSSPSASMHFSSNAVFSASQPIGTGASSVGTLVSASTSSPMAVNGSSPASRFGGGISPFPTLGLPSPAILSPASPVQHPVSPPDTDADTGLSPSPHLLPAGLLPLAHDPDLQVKCVGVKGSVGGAAGPLLASHPMGTQGGLQGSLSTSTNNGVDSTTMDHALRPGMVPVRRVMAQSIAVDTQMHRYQVITGHKRREGTSQHASQTRSRHRDRQGVRPKHSREPSVGGASSKHSSVGNETDYEAGQSQPPGQDASSAGRPLRTPADQSRQPLESLVGRSVSFFESVVERHGTDTDTDAEEGAEGEGEGVQRLQSTRHSRSGATGIHRLCFSAQRPDPYLFSQRNVIDAVRTEVLLLHALPANIRVVRIPGVALSPVGLLGLARLPGLVEVECASLPVCSNSVTVGATKTSVVTVEPTDAGVRVMVDQSHVRPFVHIHSLTLSRADSVDISLVAGLFPGVSQLHLSRVTELVGSMPCHSVSCVPGSVGRGPTWSSVDGQAQSVSLPSIHSCVLRRLRSIRISNSRSLSPASLSQCLVSVVPAAVPQVPIRLSLSLVDTPLPIPFPYLPCLRSLCLHGTSLSSQALVTCLAGSISPDPCNPSVPSPTMHPLRSLSHLSVRWAPVDYSTCTRGQGVSSVTHPCEAHMPVPLGAVCPGTGTNTDERSTSEGTLSGQDRGNVQCELSCGATTPSHPAVALQGLRSLSLEGVACVVASAASLLLRHSPGVRVLSLDGYPCSEAHTGSADAKPYPMVVVPSSISSLSELIVYTEVGLYHSLDRVERVRIIATGDRRGLAVSCDSRSDVCHTCVQTVFSGKTPDFGSLQVF